MESSFQDTRNIWYFLQVCKGLQEKMLHSCINSLGPVLRDGQEDRLGQPPRSKDHQELHGPRKIEDQFFLSFVPTQMNDKTARKYNVTLFLA